MPCCDVEQYVRESIGSLLRQTFADWECIVGVETSKDNTEGIVREYAAADGRFRVFTREAYFERQRELLHRIIDSEQ